MIFSDAMFEVVHLSGFLVINKIVEIKQEPPLTDRQMDFHSSNWWERELLRLDMLRNLPTYNTLEVWLEVGSWGKL